MCHADKNPLCNNAPALLDTDVILRYHYARSCKARYYESVVTHNFILTHMLSIKSFSERVVESSLDIVR